MSNSEQNIFPDFPETADIETSTDEYAERFKGAAGQWMLSVQEKLTFSLLKGLEGSAILDVGGGHGQLAVPLARAGWPVTVLGSAQSTAHRLAGVRDLPNFRFEVGNVIALPYPDKAFDVVISFRLLTHCERWQQLIRELTRVARRAVIVDYPTPQSLNAIAPTLFGAKKAFEKNTRHWALFRHKQVADCFAENGFPNRTCRKQFFFPMVVHRMLKTRVLSVGLGARARASALTSLFGSPVIARFTPQ